MWDEEVAPELLKRNPGIVLVKRTLKTAGLGESNVDEVLSPLLKTTNPSVRHLCPRRWRPRPIGAKAPSPAQRQSLIAPIESQMRALLTPHVWGADDDTFESVIGDMLKAARPHPGGDGVLHRRPALRHDYKRPRLQRLLPGRHRLLRHGREIDDGRRPLDYRNPRRRQSGDGNAMAQAVRKTLDADIGVGITGVAGPDPQDGVPVGQVYIAVAAGDGAPEELSFQYPQSRAAIKRRAVTQAILLLYRSLVE